MGKKRRPTKTKAVKTLPAKRLTANDVKGVKGGVGKVDKGKL